MSGDGLLTVGARGWGMVLLLCTVLPAQQPPPIAVVRQMTGEVQVRHGGQWQSVASVPTNLFDGDKVVTDQGRAEIYFPADRSTLTLDVGTNLTISQPQKAGIFRRVQVFLGDVFFRVNRTVAQQNWQLVTPTAVGGVRGTEGQVHVESETESEFRLTEGALAVRSTGARTERPQILRPGQSAHATFGQPVRFLPWKERPQPPRLNVPKEQLPKPREDRWQHVRPNERPARMAEKQAGKEGQQQGEKREGKEEKRPQRKRVRRARPHT